MDPHFWQQNYPEKNKATKQDFFVRISIEEEYILNAQFLCIILRV